MVYNFSAGPAVLPPIVLEEAATQLPNFQGTGMSIVELSHRGGHYQDVHEETLALCRRLWQIPDDFCLLFMQGGASTQFATVPLNLLRVGRSADYIDTGSWSQKAINEANLLGRVGRVAGSSRDRSYAYIPAQDQLDLDPGAEYVHLTSNNTIYGTQYSNWPDTGPVPIVADMSSDMLSRPVDWARLGLAYGGAQKNAGVAGLTVAVLRRDLLDRVGDGVPTMLRYATYANTDSLYNTPPTFAIYVFGLVLQWLERGGGLSAMQQRNAAKAALIYGVLDRSGPFYAGHAQEGSRSAMNITFNLAGRALESVFFQTAEEAGLMGLKGHRAVGGIRASIYNAMSLEGCQVLADFMADFARQHG